ADRTKTSAAKLGGIRPVAAGSEGAGSADAGRACSPQGLSGSGEGPRESRMRENRTSGSGRGRWKHDQSRARYRRVTSAPAAYSTPCRAPAELQPAAETAGALAI